MSRPGSVSLPGVCRVGPIHIMCIKEDYYEMRRKAVFSQGKDSGGTKSSSPQEYGCLPLPRFPEQESGCSETADALSKVTQPAGGKARTKSKVLKF